MQQNIVDGKTEYRFILDEDRQSLDDVVVVGYGTQKRLNLPCHQHRARRRNQGLLHNVRSRCPRRMAAGVSVTKSTGNPGESPDIIIRGAASVNGMSPLYSRRSQTGHRIQLQHQRHTVDRSAQGCRVRVPSTAPKPPAA